MEFLGHQIPILTSPGMTFEKGLTLGANRAIGAWEGTKNKPVHAFKENLLKLDEWNHVATSVNRESGIVSTYLNGMLVASATAHSTDPDLRTGNWYVGGPGALRSNQYFSGEMKELRIYDDDLSSEEIFTMYNSGEGDLGIIGLITSPIVTNTNTTELSLSFSKLGYKVAVTGLQESDFNITNGQMISDSLNASADGMIHTFQIQSSSGKKVGISIPAGSATHNTEEILGVSHSFTVMPDITNRANLVHWWWMDESKGSTIEDSIQSTSGTLEGNTHWSADAMNHTGLSFASKGDHAKLGANAEGFDFNQFSVSLWYKADADTIYRTPELVGNVLLSLGSVSSSSLQIGFSGSTFEVYMNSEIFSGTSRIPFTHTENKWNHLALTYDAGSIDGYELKLFVNSNLIGESGDFGGEMREMSSHQWYLGTSPTSIDHYGQFNGKLDDLRIFSVLLNNQDIKEIYNHGLGDFGLTVEAVNLNPVFDPTKDDQIEVEIQFKKFGSVIDVNTLDIPDLTFSLIEPDNPALGASLWLDAEDTSTVEKDDLDVLISWHNKLNEFVSLIGDAGKTPTHGPFFDGKDAVDFNFGNDSGGNSYYDSLRAVDQNGENWSALSADGSTGGQYDDVSIFIVFQVDSKQRTSWPFGTGWNGHFPWNNNSIYHDTPNRVSFSLGGVQEPMLLNTYYSNTEGFRKFYKNGFELLTDYRVSKTSAGQFKFPHSTYNTSDYTVGEILVIPRVVTDDQRLQLQAYFSKKWGLTDLLPDGHPYMSIFPNIELLGVDGNLANALSQEITKSEDNQSLVYRFTPSKNQEKYTLNITAGLATDQNSAVNHENEIEFAYGRPITKLEKLVAWWTFDDSQNSVHADEYFGRFPATFIPANRNEEVVKQYEVLLTDSSSLGELSKTLEINTEETSTDLALSPDDSFLYLLSESNQSIQWFRTSVLFDPTENASLKVWLDGDAPSSINEFSGVIESWKDRSGNGYDFSESIGNPTAETGPNGRGIVSFDGDDQLWTNKEFIGRNYTVFAVSRQTGSINKRLISSINNNWLLGYRGGYHDSWWIYDNGRLGGSKPSDHNWHLHILSSSDGDEVNFWVDFSKVSDNSNAGHNLINYPGQISLGAWKNFEEPSTGEIAEFLLFDSILSENNREKMEGYLATKWNLTHLLPGSHLGKIPQAAGVISGADVCPSPRSIAFSKDGMHAAVVSYNDNSLSLFERNETTGSLSLISRIRDGENGVEGLGGASSAVFANDGMLYVGAEIDNSISAFSTTWNPESYPTEPKLWLDASILSSSEDLWLDKSSANNHAQKTGSPVIKTDIQNGLSVMHYTGNGQRHKFNMISNIRTVFWVISQDSHVNGSGFRYVLTDTTGHPAWHNQNNGRFWSLNSWTNNRIRNGTTRLNGMEIDGRYTYYPNELSIISVKTTGNVQADSFGYDRGWTSRQWVGKLGELLIYSSPLSDKDMHSVESYLARKWGLVEGLAESHPYKSRSAPSLSFKSFLSNGNDGVSGLNGVSDVVVSSDNKQVIAVGKNDNSLVFFDRQENSADLTFGGLLTDGSGGVDGLQAPTSTALSPDGRFLYVSAEGDHAVSWYQTYLDPLAFPENLVLWLDAQDPNTLQSSSGNISVGWTNSRLYGDNDSGISSNFVYTTAVNLEGSTRTVNGVTFSGTTASSGSGWHLDGFSSSIPSNHGSADSTATGDIGAILDDGFKYSGTQKLTISGLTPGQTYVLALYSQAWGSSLRTNVITCSALSETITVHQDEYNGQTPDSLLTECTYIANGTNVEFTFSENSWHLYAFSNRHASKLDHWLDKSGNSNHAVSISTKEPVLGSVEVIFGGGQILQVNNDPFKNLDTPAAVVLGRLKQQESTLISWAGYPEQAHGWRFFGNQQDYQLNFSAPDNYELEHNATYTLNSPFIGAFFREGNSLIMRMNGNEVGSTDIESNSLSYAAYSNRSAIGGYFQGDGFSTSSGHMTGALQEVIVLSSANSDTIEKIEGYLAKKWNHISSLPDSHTYKTLVPSRDPVYLGKTGDSTTLNGPSHIVLSNDGSQLFAASPSTNSVSLFIRDPSTGALTYQTKVDDVTNANRLTTANKTPRTFVVSSGQAKLTSLDQTDPARTQFSLLADGNWIGSLKTKFASTDRLGNSVTHYLVGGDGDDDNSLFILDPQTGTLVNRQPVASNLLGQKLKIRVKHRTDKHYEIFYDKGIFGTALKFPGFTRAETSGSADELGIFGHQPRTVSLWIKAMSGSSSEGVIYGLGDFSNFSSFGLQGTWNGSIWDRMKSIYHNSSDSFSNPSGFFEKWTHLAHSYDGQEVRIYINGTLADSFNRGKLNTRTKYPLTFGGLGPTSNTYQNFVGLMDDVRIYSTDLDQSDVNILYGHGGGDFLIRPVISVDPIIEGDFANGSIQFLLQDHPVASPNLSENNISISNGKIDPGSLQTDDNITWTFIFSTERENEPVTLSLSDSIVTDNYNETSLSGSVSTLKMYRNITRAEDLAAWWSFDRDHLGSNLVNSDGKDQTEAVLYDATVSQIGRFGQGITFDKTRSTGRMKIEPSGIQLSQDGWSLSVWCKNIIPPKENGFSTLFRGQDRQSDFDFDRYLSIRGSDKMLGFLDGDEEITENRFKNGSYSLDAYEHRGWILITVVADVKTTKYYMNGSFVAKADIKDQSDLFYVGNSSENELFAEHIDDLRVYNVALSPMDTFSIFGNGYGDGLISAKIENNSTNSNTQKTLKVTFGKDGEQVFIENLLQDENALGLDFGEVLELNQTDDLSTYLISLGLDHSRVLHNLSIPGKPIRFDDVVLWLDANDPQGGTFVNETNAKTTLWLDAADLTTIEADENDNVSTWANKVDSSVKMYSHATNKPNIGESINGLNALGFDKRSTDNVEHMTAKKNESTNWTPATSDGEISGKIQNVALMMVARLDTTRKSIFPFGFGWNDHFPWDNGSVFWKHESDRPTFRMGNNGAEFVLSMIHSKVLGKQLAYMNGNLVFDGPRTNDNQLGNMGTFVWPSNIGTGGLGRTGWGIDWTTGEIIAIAGNITDTNRQVIEGYLAHKWGQDSKLPSDHPYRSEQPLSVSGTDWTPSHSFGELYWTDKSTSMNHAKPIGSPSLIVDAQNGLPVMRYSGNSGESHSFGSIDNARTIFWVVSEDPTVSGSGARPLLGSSADPAADFLNELEETTLWLDAADPSTIVTSAGNEVDTWENKVNPDVKMSSWSNKPSYDATINSVAAIDINSANGQREGFNAYKNGSAWSPASANGVASGPVEDVVVILAWRVDTNNRTTFPFNFGWGDHLPWSNGSIFWHFSDNRKSVHIASNNESVLTILEFSTTKGIQNVYKNGSLKLTGPRTSPTYIGGAFFFPGNGGDSNYNPDFTLGELLVLRGILSEEEREKIEGYLAHKWGISLAADHTFVNSPPWSSSSHWANDTRGNIWGENSSPHIFNGITRLNGTAIDGNQTAKPTELSIISLQATDDLSVDNFSYSQGYSWKGDLAELIIYDKNLTLQQVEFIEGYLAHKWGILDELTTLHSYKANVPLYEFGQYATSANKEQFEPFVHPILNASPVHRMEDLISRWSFDEVSAGLFDHEMVYDHGKAENNAYLMGDAKLGTGRFGKALQLDEPSGYALIPFLRCPSNAQALTFSAWIKLDQIGTTDDSDDGVIFSTDGSSNSHTRLWYDVNAITGGDRTFSFMTGSPSLASNLSIGGDNLASAQKWQLIIGIMSGLQRQIFVDGKLVAENQSALPSLSLSGNSARIGSWDLDENSYFKGLIDELRIYKSAFSSEDVDALWNQGIGDLGIVPKIDIASLDTTGDINGTVRFLQVGLDVDVSDFNSSDLDITGGALVSLLPKAGTYEFLIRPDRPGIPISINLSKGAAKSVDGTSDSESFSYRFSPSPAIIAQDDLSLWYTFEGNASDTVFDLSLRQVDGTLVGGTREYGKFSQSLRMDQEASLTIPPQNFSFNKNFTLSIWAKILDDAEGILAHNGQFSFRYADDLSVTAQCYLDGSWRSVRGGSILGKWAHYAVVLGESDLNLFVNGLMESSISVSGRLGSSSTENLFLASANSPSLSPRVIIDDLRIYSRALSSDEISHIYGFGSGDLGIRPLVSGPSPFLLNPTSQALSFFEDANELSTGDLNLTQLSLESTNGSIENFDESNFSYLVNAANLNEVIRVHVPYGYATKDGNYTQSGAFEFLHRQVTQAENGLIAWYTFDETNNSQFHDRSGNLRHAPLSWARRY